MDDASGRVYCGIHHGIVLSIQFVFVFKNLDAEEFGYEYGRGRAEAYDKSVFPVKLHTCLLFTVIRCENLGDDQAKQPVAQQ